MSSKDNFKVITKALQQVDAMQFLNNFVDQDVRDDGVEQLILEQNLSLIIPPMGARNRFINKWREMTSMASPSHIRQKPKFNDNMTHDRPPRGVAGGHTGDDYG
eukprot:881602_1